MSANDPDQPHLKRVLGRADLVLLFVVAVFNLNVVPSIAANGGVTVWLWLDRLMLVLLAAGHRGHRTGSPLSRGRRSLFVGQGSVRRLPRFFVRLVLLDEQHALCADSDAVLRRRVGVCSGSGPSGLADNKAFALAASLALLTVLVVLNIVGLGVGKWVNNLGGIGTGIAAATLIGLGVVIWLAFWHDSQRRGFQDSRESALRAEFFRRNLFWTGGPRTGFGHGRRDPGSRDALCPARLPGVACSQRLALHRRHAHFADCGEQGPDQRAAGHRAGGGSHGGKSWSLAGSWRRLLCC